MHEEITGSEFIQKYGDIDIVFSSYDKFVFNFCGEFKNKYFMISFGGDSDDIYRCSLSRDMKISNLKDTDLYVFSKDKE